MIDTVDCAAQDQSVLMSTFIRVDIEKIFFEKIICAQ